MLNIEQSPACKSFNQTCAFNHFSSLTYIPNSYSF